MVYWRTKLAYQSSGPPSDKGSKGSKGSKDDKKSKKSKDSKEGSKKAIDV